MKHFLLIFSTFFLFIGGIVLLVPKRTSGKGLNSHCVQDKPTVCKECGALMWQGAQAHFCKVSLEEAN